MNRFKLNFRNVVDKYNIDTFRSFGSVENKKILFALKNMCHLLLAQQQ